jgi:dihydropteroate synthase
MGIVNITPDSFSDGGRFLNADSAVAQARQLVVEGADILDLGAESTRPGAEFVSDDEELHRLLPVVERLAAEVAVPLSIDTNKAVVARACLERGAHIINDISGLTFDPEMIAVCRDFECGIVCMHIQGTPQTMQLDPRYDDVVGEVKQFLKQRLDAMESAGISRERVALDPGVGFGKTAAHNVELLQRVDELHDLGCAVLVGHSRKRFLQKVLNRPVDERLFGTLGVSLALAEQGVDILRIHDIAPHRDALTAWEAIHRPGVGD